MAGACPLLMEPRQHPRAAPVGNGTNGDRQLLASRFEEHEPAPTPGEVRWRFRVSGTAIAPRATACNVSGETSIILGRDEGCPPGLHVYRKVPI